MPRPLLLSILLAFSSSVFAMLEAGKLETGLAEMEQRARVDPTAALEELEAAQPLLDNADQNTRMWYFIRRAQAHNALFMYDEFELDVSQAAALNNDNAPLHARLWLGVYEGLIHTRKGRLEQGIETLASTAQLALESRADQIFVYTVAELAFTRGVLQQYDESLLDLQQAYAKAIELAQPELVAAVYDAYGAVYGYMRDYPRALEYYRLALLELEDIGYKEQIASVTLGLASTYRYAKEPEKAEQWFLRYLEATRYATGSHNLFYGWYGLAMTYAEQDDCEQALPRLERSLQMVGPGDYKAELLKHLARCKAQSGDFEAAEVALQDATDILTAIPELAGTTWILDLKKVESQIEYFRGNTSRAFELLSEYQKEYLQHVEKNSSNSMNMLRAELEHDRKDLEIALLEGEAQLQQLRVDAQLKQNRLQQYLILLSVAISLVILGGLLVQLRSNRRILALSHRDGLSGLYNRRYTFEYLEKVISRSAEADSELSIILMDIDDFKRINDMEGHPMGDAVIKRIAEISESSLRNRDIMGRIGGEEFLCVLPRTSVEQSTQVAQRLLDAISAEVFTCENGSTFSITMSLGIAHNGPTVASAQDLYANADKAMYKSKHAGKGCITTYQGN